MRYLFEPRLVNDTFGDPVLYVDVRDERRALLFDLGDITALAPRKLMRLSHVFVTHAHMDHFSGFDHLLRVILGRKSSLTLFGGPCFIAQVEHKLRAYTWNVVDRYATALVIDVYEMGLEGWVERARFSSRMGFVPERLPPLERDDDVLLEEATICVRGRFVDHGIACLAFALEEKAHLNVDKDRIAALALGVGPWLREMKRAVLSGAPDGQPIEVRWRDKNGEHTSMRAVGELRDVVLDITPGQRIGYVTDLRYTESNVDVLSQLMQGIDLLYIEGVFLEKDKSHAERKNHLTGRQAGEIARRLGAKAIVPVHFSPRYAGRRAELIAEIHAAWRG
ncbi:MAG: ribonuclease Z [Betaproteobacteria bacterium]|nr:ribonuclease Z [Betaproteobacteria bacterium]